MFLVFSFVVTLGTRNTCFPQLETLFPVLTWHFFVCIPFFFSLLRKKWCIPLAIGAYKPSFIMKNQHMDPCEAVNVHKDIHAVRSLAMVLLT